MTAKLIKTLAACLTDLLFQLEYADDDQMNSDFAVNLMEATSAELQNLGQTEIEAFMQAVEELAAAETIEDRKAYLAAFGENFGLTDTS